MITFVTFHIDPVEASLPSDTPVDLAKRAKCSDDYRDMIALMFQSVSVFHNSARKVILTDKNAAFTNLTDDVEIYRYEMDTSDVMLSRTKAQLAFLEAHDFESNVMFLDSDILINDDLETSLKWTDFDVALTIRDDPLGMPINGGALFLSHRQPHRVLQFFRVFYQTYIDKYLNESQWWGDQKALVEMLSSDANLDQPPLVASQRNVGEAVVQLVPCNIFNYSPSFKQAIDIYGSGVGKSVMHFKGDRKQYMQSFWDSCIHIRQLQSNAQFNVLQHQLDSLQQDRQQLQQALTAEQKTHRASQKRYRALEKKHNALEQRYKSLVKHPFKSGLKAIAKVLKRQLQQTNAGTK